MLEDKFLAPSASDVENHSEFLKGPHTGLIRLLPREDFDKPEKSTIRGGGAFYSFIRKTHEHGHGNDIHLGRDMFSVGFAGADYGFIGMLPDGSVESVGLEHPAAKYLASLKVPVKLADARIEQRRRRDGMIVDGIHYKGHVQALVGKTYVLRSIGYNKWDILVCFQVVRKDSDGSYILAWKMLMEFNKPELQRTPDGN